MREIERAIFRPWLLGVRIGLLKPAHNAITAETANDSCCWAAADEEAANDGDIIYYKVLIGGSGGAMEARRLVAAPFLVKTYRLVDDPSTDHIVSWGDNNDTFVVWDPKEFSASVLPSYFNHTNFSSFVRQLNTYEFRKILRRRCEYENKLFQKGEKHLLSLIQRRKSSTASLFRPISSTQDSIVPAAVASLSEENETLRRNNSPLLSDIAGLQNICSSDMSLNRSTWADSPLMINMHRSKICRTDVAEDNSVSTLKLFGVPLY